MTPRGATLPGGLRLPLDMVYLELTNVCDFSCAFCPKELMTRPPRFMDPSLARSILDQIAALNVAPLVYFHVMGEPALHPEFPAIVDHAAALGLKTGLTTNGARLGLDTGRMLLERDFAEINVSLQTPDERSFALRRARGIDYPAYEAGILEFFRAYRARRPDTVVRFRFLNTLHAPPAFKARGVRVLDSTKDLRQALAQWAGKVWDAVAVGADDVFRARALRRLGRVRSFVWNRIEVWPRVWFETFLAGDWSRAFEERPVIPAWAGYCPSLREHFAILASGDLTLCCLDFDGKTVVGDLNTQSLEEILGSKKMARIARGFRRLRPVLPFCKRCQGSATRAGWMFRPLGLLLALRILRPIFLKTTSLTSGTREGGK